MESIFKYHFDKIVNVLIGIFLIVLFTSRTFMDLSLDRYTNYIAINSFILQMGIGCLATFIGQIIIKSVLYLKIRKFDLRRFDLEKRVLKKHVDEKMLIFMSTLCVLIYLGELVTGNIKAYVELVLILIMIFIILELDAQQRHTIYLFEGGMIACGHICYFREVLSYMDQDKFRLNIRTKEKTYKMNCRNKVMFKGVCEILGVSVRSNVIAYDFE